MKFGILGIIVAIIVIASICYFSLSPLNTPSNYIREHKIIPPSISDVVKPISFKEFLNKCIGFLKKHNATLLLPTWIPGNLKPVAVWYAPHSNFIAIIVYDNKSVKSPYEAKFGFELDFLSYPPNANFTNTTKFEWLKKVLEDTIKVEAKKGFKSHLYIINGLLIHGIEKEAHDYIIIEVYDVKNGLKYVFGCKCGCGITYEDLLRVVKSLKPVKYA